MVLVLMDVGVGFPKSTNVSTKATYVQGVNGNIYRYIYLYIVEA